MVQAQFINRPQTFGEQFGSNLGQGLSTGLVENLNQMLKTKELDRREKEFVQRGYPPQLARLAAVSTTGGQTEAFKYLLENIKRGNHNQNLNQNQPSGNPNDDLPTNENIQPQNEESNEVGLTPAEKVRRQESRYKSNLPIFSEAKSKLDAFELEKARLDRLNALNETGKLPANLGRLNVDFKTGNLVFPAGANPETQSFVKTVNDFIAGAKDTFGSRVTNFDLQTFLQRLPTLANSEEGRRAILRQMQIINELNTLHNSSLIDSYNKSGGLAKSDFDKVSNNSEKSIKDKKDQLTKEFSTIQKNFGKKENTFEDLPDPKKLKGKKIQDEDTGEILISDGNQWVPQGKK